MLFRVLLAVFVTLSALVSSSVAQMRSTNAARASSRVTSEATMPSSGDDQGEVVTARFCDLVTRPNDFDDKMVRVQAVFESTWEWARLYDATCRNRNNYVWPRFQCNTIEACETFSRRIEKDMVGNPFRGQRVGITAVGRFRAAKPGQRFGVQGGLKFQFEIVEIEDTNRLSDRVRKR